MVNIAQYRHDSKVKPVRVNGQITEVKQLYILPFLGLAEILGKLGKFAKFY